MEEQQIGLVIQFVKDCGKEVTAELVLYVCNVIDPSITLKQVERAIAEDCFQDEVGMQALEADLWQKHQNGSIDPRDREECPGWPPTAQETVYYQQIMAKPDEF